MCVCVFLVLCVLLVLFCVSFLFRHCVGPIGLCTSSFHQDEEFVTALINWQFAACNSVLIDLAKAEAMDRKKSVRTCRSVDIVVSQRKRYSSTMEKDTD